jgi:hypothetical protein
MSYIYLTDCFNCHQLPFVAELMEREAPTEKALIHHLNYPIDARVSRFQDTMGDRDQLSRSIPTKLGVLASFIKMQGVIY